MCIEDSAYPASILHHDGKPGPLRFHLQPHQDQRLREHAVRVHIDGLHATPIHDHLAAPRGRPCLLKDAQVQQGAQVLMALMVLTRRRRAWTRKRCLADRGGPRPS